MGKNIKWSPKINAEIELKKLGTIMGHSLYVDLAGLLDDDHKFSDFLVIQKMLQDLFHPPENEESEDDQPTPPER